MIIDTSILVAIMISEDNAPHYTKLLLDAKSVKISSATLLETTTVITNRLGEEYVLVLHDFLSEVGCVEIPFTDEHRAAAEYGQQKYGKGRGHPAQLNLGDCYSYGLAKASGEHLLFQGEDFNRTDLSWIDLETGQEVSGTP